MKKFLQNISLFMLPLVILSAIIFCVPVNRKYAYAFINRGGCEGRSSWIYQQIFEDTTPIDIAFIGTSHTMNAVNDEDIEKLMNDSLKANLHVKNIAYCGKGRDFDFVIIRDLLQHKKIKLLVVEVQQTESRESHRDFLHIATARDLLTAPILSNPEYISELYKGFLVRLQYLREKVTGEDIRHVVDFAQTKYGYNGDNLLARSEDIQKAKEEAKNTDHRYNYYAMQYVGKIAQLARQNNTPLVFLYLPRYGCSVPDKSLVTNFEQYGKIICSPHEIFDDPADWRDVEHVNATGTNQITHYLVYKLGEELHSRNSTAEVKVR